MISQKNFNPRHSTELYGLNKEFDNLKNLILSNKLPKVTLLTGQKGIGKLTLINHLVINYFDKINYNLLEKKIIQKNNFFTNLSKDLISNVIYVDSNNFKIINLETIRNLKTLLQKKPIYNDKRFIILDNVETFNINSINALLKIIEEPNDNDYFILINNKMKPLLETLKSRCLEYNIDLKKDQREVIIKSIIKKYNLNITIDQNLIYISPGNFLRYNSILNDYKIDISEKFFKNFKTLLDIYIKTKSSISKDLLLFYSEYYLKKKKDEKNLSNTKFIRDRSFLLSYINDFFLYNLNKSTLLRSIENRFYSE